jgi:hypothetical protein
MVLEEAPDSPGFMIPFLIITVMNLIKAVQLLRHIEVRKDEK